MKIYVISNPKKEAADIHLSVFDGDIDKTWPSRTVKNLLGKGLQDITVAKINLDGANALLAFVETESPAGEKTPIMKLPQALRDELPRYWQYRHAREFALRVHGDQRYSSGTLPYYYHLKQTDKVVDRFLMEFPAGRTLTLKMAALLHDVLEDTPATMEDLTREFGPEVADIVRKVTKVDEVNTKEYEAAYYAQVAENPLAVVIKIADKCANTKQTVKAYSAWHAKRIIDGHQLFKDYTYGKIESPALKAYLDGLVHRLEKLQ